MSLKQVLRIKLMPLSKHALTIVLIIASMIGVRSFAQAQQFTQEFKQSLHWRNIGPFRAGRTRAVAGVPSQPNVFYIAAVNGGVWKTTDFGRTWTPIFDDQPTGSIGSIAVAPSKPEIVFVGSGEGLHRPDLSVGDGVYKSTDGGKSWTHLGLSDGQQIAQIAINPRNADRIFVAVAGHPYGPNEERGIYRSMNGGKTFEKVLYRDENTGGADVQIDPSNPETVYASMWEAREGPWENGSWNGPGGGIFKSTDGGATWRQLTKGLPDDIVQANLAIAPSTPTRLFAAVAKMTGVSLYRSDDNGESWAIATSDTRPATRIGGGDLPVFRFDPKNADILYSASIVCWKSTDGGKTWTGIRGAPGGDDYQNIWINPFNTDIILLGSDQGAIISVNGGKSWSSWYNQPTAQIYHVAADNAFPYRLCGGQQESGSVCISSRGNDGEITFREWHPVGAEEYGYVTPDPLDPDIVYGGKLTRYDRRTTQAQNILPQPFRSATFRMLRTEPVIFSPLDPHILYFAANTLWKTKDGGQNWEQLSPDLTRKTFDVPANVGKYRSMPTAQPTQRGVIYTVAPSPIEAGRIWAGTDDGLVHLTTDGGAHWADVTPSQLSAWQKISLIDASHFDAQTAYAAVNTIRLDDLRPHIYRTRDSGKSWTEITVGIPKNENVNVVREDTQRRGLLFAGTERAVYVSFDDGDHWQPLRLNMPASSVRDVIVKDDDLVAATHGRGFWILDDITPLRQLDAKVISSSAFLFRPQTALRVRWNTNPDTPLPPDVPAGENPPDGAVINYYLSQSVSGPVTLEIRDSSGQTVRRYSSADAVSPVDASKLRIPTYWLRPPQVLSAERGMHRFIWDMHYEPVPGIDPQYPIAAVYRNTAPDPTSPWVMPGQYTIVLTVGGTSFTQPLVVKMDPRVKTSLADLGRQLELSKQLYNQWAPLNSLNERINSLNEELVNLRSRAGENSAVAAGIDALIKKLQELAGATNPRPGEPLNLGVLARLQTLFGILQEVDAAPTIQVSTAVTNLQREIQSVIEGWRVIESQDIPALNRQLKGAGLPELKLKEPDQNKKVLSQEFEDNG